ncbi:MAG TPA: FUSC family protein [Verrucomicrobiae bacterium]|nr:FUSC family protein [Verrucomicrobiae bacterium]
MAKNFIERAKGAFWHVWKARGLEHAVRTGLAAAASLAVASLCGMPEAYWAPITTLIVMQSTLGAAWAISKQRLIGTALGAAMGALVAGCFDRGIVAFGLAIFALGAICGTLRLDQAAYKFAGITLAIVMLIARADAIWITAIHRFVEVSLGIAVALIFAGVWPRRELPVNKP